LRRREPKPARLRRRSETAFDKAADGAEDSFEDIADAAEDGAKKTSEVWTGALREVGAKLVQFGVKGAAAIAGFIADTISRTRAS